jgi:hypothetical protein
MKVPKVKVKAWSVAGQKIADKIKPEMPAPMKEQLEEQARLQGVKDVFGYDVEFDSQAAPSNPV